MKAFIPMADERKTGYGFLADLDGGGYHLGEDQNSGDFGAADLGLPIKATFDGVVKFAGYMEGGFGNMIIIYSDYFKRWHRTLHHRDLFVKKGDSVKGGQKIATCGKSGTKSPHNHWEIWKKQIVYKSYPKNWSKRKIQSHFESPYEFVARANKFHELGIPPWAWDSWEAAEARGEIFMPPQKKIDLKTMQQLMKNAGVTTDVGAMPFYRALVWRDKVAGRLK